MGLAVPIFHHLSLWPHKIRSESASAGTQTGGEQKAPTLRCDLHVHYFIHLSAC